MKIPQYWAKGEATIKDRRGRDLAIGCWRWSDVSPTEAEQAAAAHARDITARFQMGQQLDRYAYTDRPLREEVVDRLIDHGRESALITRNSYGALVLNTARVMFIDIDFGKEHKPGPLASVFRRLGSKATPSQETQHLARIEEWARQHPQWSIRIYRTFGGLRGLITNELFEPADRGSIEILNSLNSDPLYVRLCRAQECFRARLTPKPWRCGAVAPPGRYPWPTTTAELTYREWEKTYDDTANRYTTCRLVKELGSWPMHSEVARVVEIHDRTACRGDNLNLA
jgi:hypothetical protein